jgi:hypothetical protein
MGHDRRLSGSESVICTAERHLPPVFDKREAFSHGLLDFCKTSNVAFGSTPAGRPKENPPIFGAAFRREFR